jgi:hypothetical protein
MQAAIANLMALNVAYAKSRAGPNINKLKSIARHLGLGVFHSKEKLVDLIRAAVLFVL